MDRIRRYCLSRLYFWRNDKKGGKLVEGIKEEEIKDLVLKNQNNLMNILLSIEDEIYKLKSQEREISSKRKYLETQYATLKEKIKLVLEENEISKIETESGKLSIRKNPISVEIIDESLIPNKYKKLIQTIQIDKKEIINDFKETGELIEGVKINSQNTSLQIN